MKRILIASVFAALVLTGCSSGPSVVGKWTEPTPKIPGAVVTTEFTQDGTITQTVDMKPMGQEMQVVGSGTYQVNGEKISMTIKDVQITKMAAALESSRSTILEAAKKEMNKKTDFQLKFVGKDSIELSGSDGKILMARVKS